MLDNAPDIMTVKDLMKAFQIGKNKALGLLKEGQITGHRISGNRWRILKEDVLEYVLRS